MVRFGALLLSSALLVSPALAGDGWHTNYEKATKAAAKANVPILADFTGSDWCFWCKKLKREVFETPEFKAWAKGKVVLLELDFPSDKSGQSAALRAQNEKLVNTYSIEGYPTIVFMDAKGKELGRLGYEKGGPSNWTASADRILTKANKRAKRALTWTEDYDAALAQAAATGKLVLADFTGSDWCGWCIRLKKEVFETPEFEAWASKSVILLELDYPVDKPQTDALKARNKALLKKYGVAGYPTILFLDGKGRQVGRMAYERGGPAPWIKKAQAIVDAVK